MGHEGMHYSLVSREVITDSEETVMSAERLDGSVLLAGCDKSIPGMLMAAARLDLSSVFLYNGSTMPGTTTMSDGSEREVTLIDALRGRRRLPRRHHERGRRRRHRTCRLPRRGRLRRHVHRQHHGVRR
ncbi:dihydroxy-acid dehydratase [Corynebacterium suedekumii]|nr:dihydroxy-acid dehydratase [Corynebacterium suedekumii]